LPKRVDEIPKEIPEHYQKKEKKLKKKKNK